MAVTSRAPVSRPLSNMSTNRRLTNPDSPCPPAAEDHAINIWDLGSARLIKKMTGHTSSIHSLSFSAESSLLVSGGADCTVRVWDVKSSAQEADGVFGAPAAKESAVATRRSSKIGPVAGTTLGELPMNDVSAADDALNAHVVSDIRCVPVQPLVSPSQTDLLLTLTRSGSLLSTYPTKRTSILNVQFTPRNLCLVAGYTLPTI